MKGYENWEKHHLLFLFHDIGCFFWGGGTSDRDLRYTRWKDAVKRTLGWESVTEEDDEVNPGNSPAWVSLQPFSPIPTRDTHPTRCKPWWKVQRTTRLLIPSCPPPPPQLPNQLFRTSSFRCLVRPMFRAPNFGCDFCWLLDWLRFFLSLPVQPVERNFRSVLSPFCLLVMSKFSKRARTDTHPVSQPHHILANSENNLRVVERRIHWIQSGLNKGKQPATKEVCLPRFYEENTNFSYFQKLPKYFDIRRNLIGMKHDSER